MPWSPSCENHCTPFFDNDVIFDHWTPSLGNTDPCLLVYCKFMCTFRQSYRYYYYVCSWCMRTNAMLTLTCIFSKIYLSTHHLTPIRYCGDHKTFLTVMAMPHSHGIFFVVLYKCETEYNESFASQSRNTPCTILLFFINPVSFANGWIELTH